MTIGRRITAILIVVVPVLGLGRPFAWSQQSFPPFSAPVVDQAGVVPDEVERQVGSALEDYRARSGNQVAVAVVKTTGKRSIEDYSIDLAREWGVGTKEKDNGVLLLIAFDDRKLRIEVGRGLEGTLTDLESGRIVRERLVPLLRQGDVGGAVVQGTEAIRKDLGDPQVGQLRPPPRTEEEPSSNAGWAPLLLLGLLPLAGLAFVGRRRRWGMGGGPIFYGGGWGGYGGGFGGGYGGGFGGGGGFSGGGGFGGGGGGGFGGGGASGGW